MQEFFSRSCSSVLEMEPLPSLSKALNASQHSAVHVDTVASPAAARKSEYEIFPSPSVSIRVTSALIWTLLSTIFWMSSPSSSSSWTVSLLLNAWVNASTMSCVGTRPSPDLSSNWNCCVNSASFAPVRWSAANAAAVRLSTVLSLKCTRLRVTLAVRDPRFPLRWACVSRASASHGWASAWAVVIRSAGSSLSMRHTKSRHISDIFGSDTCHWKFAGSARGPCVPNGRARESRANAITPMLQTSAPAARCWGSSSGAEYSDRIRCWRHSFGGTLMYSRQAQSVTTSRESAAFDAKCTLSGLRSWCTMPLAWECAMAAQIWLMIHCTRLSASGPASPSSISNRSPPVYSSMTMYTWVSSSKVSISRWMLGWSSSRRASMCLMNTECDSFDARTSSASDRPRCRTTVRWMTRTATNCASASLPESGPAFVCFTWADVFLLASFIIP
mmetsp:Transcript_46233/g.140159  ORF Transcript_46233/g.140159 Transcript_46233/m.140159 type:complete len:445 (-) Transcript_46233:283-1617(-)